MHVLMKVGEEWVTNEPLQARFNQETGTDTKSDVWEEYYVRMDTGFNPVYTVAFFKSDKDQEPIWFASVDSNCNLVESGCIGPAVSEVFDWTAQQVRDEVLTQLACAHLETSDPSIYHSHPKFGKTCWYGEKSEN